MITSMGVGEYAPTVATDKHVIFAGRSYRSDGTKRPVLWCHSAGGDALEALTETNVYDHLYTITESLGLPLISFDAQGVQWGNDNAQSRLADALAYLRTTWGAHATLLPLIIGVSMGGMLALNWARANPGGYAALALLYPATSLQAIHDGAGGAANGAATTEAAYGGSLATFNAAVATHDPAQNAAAYFGKPIKMWRSSADTVVGTANQDAFASAAGVAVADLGAVAHADMVKIYPGEVAAFLRSYL